MPYSDYSLNDFALDEYFQRWVLVPDRETNSFWQAWIAQHPEKESFIIEARKIVELICFNKYDFSEEDSLKVWETINLRIGDFESRNEQDFFGREGSALLTRRWHKIAAVLLGMMFISSVWFLLKSPVGMTEYATGYGETKLIILPDSSTVILNANSSLKYYPDWLRSRRNQERDAKRSSSERRVWLSGEAYFSVVKNVNQEERAAKFIVHTSNLNVEVLGTKFHVSNRRSRTEVVLSSGKVKLNTNFEMPDKSRTLIMKPGELVAVSDASTQITKKEVDPEVYSAWRENKLVFDEMPLRQIAMILKDNYGKKVIFEDTMTANKKFKGTFPADNIDVLISTLLMSFNIKISDEKGLVTFFE
jgi:transmembrane sensor